MSLKQTKLLVDRYRDKLVNGTITDRELEALMDIKSFPKSAGYVEVNKPVSDKNHSQSDAINDFVLAVAPRLMRALLHQLTARLINLAPDAGRNTFMRNSAFEKAFLAYELAQFPQAAQIFFLPTTSIEPVESAKYQEFQARKRMQNEFSGINDLANLQRVILKPIIDWYTQKNVTYHYRHAIYNETGGRYHAYKVCGDNFSGLPEHLKGLRGDRLKSQILLDFKMQLMDASTQAEVEELVTAFKTKAEHAVLEAGQGFITLKFHRPTSSLRAFEQMINERKQDINVEQSNKSAMSIGG